MPSIRDAAVALWILFDHHLPWNLAEPESNSLMEGNVSTGLAAVGVFMWQNPRSVLVWLSVQAQSDLKVPL